MVIGSTRWLCAGILGAILALPSGLQAQTSWQWAAVPASGSTGQSHVYAAVVESSGNVVVAGGFSGTMTLGGTTLTSAGGNDIFVARLSSAGTWIQAVSAGSAYDDYALAVAVDGSGNIAVGGYYSGPSASFGSINLPNLNTDVSSRTNEGFVARLNSSGVWTQAVRVSGAANESVVAVALDAAGTITAAGNFSSNTTSLGATNLTNSNNNSSNDVFVARLSSAGTWTQVVQGGGGGDDFVHALAVDGSGNATVAGDFNNATLSLGTLTLSNANSSQYSSDIFVARLNSAGTWTQAARAGGSGNEYSHGVALDGSGNATVAGNFASSTITFGTTVLTNANSTTEPTSDIFVARLNNAGTWTLAARGGGSGNDYTNALAVDANGRTSVVGSFDGMTSAFGTNVLANADASGKTGDILVARLTTTGTWDLALRAGGVGDDYTNALALDGGGNAVLGGDLYSSPSVFGTVTLDRYGSGYVAKLMGLVTPTLAAREVGAFTLAPNPARGVVRLHWPTSRLPEPVLLLDALGRVVRRQVLPAQSAQATLDLQGLTAGVYVVRVGQSAQRLLVE